MRGGGRGGALWQCMPCDCSSSVGVKAHLKTVEEAAVQVEVEEEVVVVE